MNSFEDTKRQLRFALIAIAIIIPVAIIGYMLIEDFKFLEAVWLTVVTLGTIGYGDIVPRSPEGRIFTLVWLFFGIGSFAVLAQAAVQYFVNPQFREFRQRNRAERKISALRNHYIVCGEGELVDKTISNVIRRSEVRHQQQEAILAEPIDHLLNRIFGEPAGISIIKGIKAALRKMLISYQHVLHRSETILDAIVIVTKDNGYAEYLRGQGLLVINDDPTEDKVLQQAGIDHAQAVMCMLESDTETLLNVLTVRSQNSNVYITATTLSDLSLKMIRVGANNVLAPYDVASQFLNNATLRPAVNDFFNSILFDQNAEAQMVQLYLWDDSHWIGKTIGELRLRERFNAGIIGLRLADGRYLYVPPDSHLLKEDEVVLVTVPGSLIQALQADCRGNKWVGPKTPNWQRLPNPHVILKGEKSYSMNDAEDVIKGMSQHFIICGSDPIIRNSLDKLNPERPFVVLSNDNELSREMLQRGFRVIHGNPAKDETLHRAGVDRALAIMVSIEDKADSVLTVLNCRTLSKRILITATAATDDMIPKLRRAGADRVVSPFRIAAQFVLLATTRPAVSDFLQYVVFNYQAQIETTELYMQDDSPWIGKKIGELLLDRIFQARVIGIRQANSHFIYAPPESYTIQRQEVLIVTTPMIHSDELRHIAHGSQSKRPVTLRNTDAMRTTAGINYLR